MRRPLDYYPTPPSVVDAIVQHWPGWRRVYDPCCGDGRVGNALRGIGVNVIETDIASGDDFFALANAPEPALVTNPPFKRIREFIDHAFEIETRHMLLVCPERLWACKVGQDQFARHTPSRWINLTWREDYLGKGGAPDRALAIAIWHSRCADKCEYEIWKRPEAA